MLWLQLTRDDDRKTLKGKLQCFSYSKVCAKRNPWMLIDSMIGYRVVSYGGSYEGGILKTGFLQWWWVEIGNSYTDKKAVKKLLCGGHTLSSFKVGTLWLRSKYIRIKIRYRILTLFFILTFVECFYYVAIKEKTAIIFWQFTRKETILKTRFQISRPMFILVGY